MLFEPKGGTYVSDIEKGQFTCYEVKSCIEDVYSGSGLNFYGDKNYIVTTILGGQMRLIDAVEVVRCKDCKHSEFIDYSEKDYRCKFTGEDIYDNDFCSYGERK